MPIEIVFARSDFAGQPVSFAGLPGTPLEGQSQFVAAWGNPASEGTMEVTASGVIVNASGTIVTPAHFAGFTVGPDNGQAIQQVVPLRVEGTPQAGRACVIVPSLIRHEQGGGPVSRSYTVRLDGVVIGAFTLSNPVPYSFPVPATVKGAILIVSEAVAQGTNSQTFVSADVPFSTAPGPVNEDALIAPTSTEINLGGWTSPSGRSWATLQSNGWKDALRINTLGLYAPFSTLAAYGASDALGPDQFVGSVVQRRDYSNGPSNSFICPSVRLVSAGTTFSCYRVRYNAQTNAWELLRTISGADTVIASIPNAGFDYDDADKGAELALAVKGQRLLLWINGTPAIDFTDTNTTIAAGKIGLSTVGSAPLNTVRHRAFFGGTY